MKHVYVFLVSLFCFSFFNVAEAQIPEPNLVYLAEFDVNFNKNARKSPASKRQRRRWDISVILKQ